MHESFRDHKLPFGPHEIFSVAPSAILVEFDFKFGDRQIKSIIKRGALPVLAVCPGVLSLVFEGPRTPKSGYILHVRL